MNVSVNELLTYFLDGLDEILAKFEEFFESYRIEVLKEATCLLSMLGMVYLHGFTQIKHSILPSSAYEASVMIRKKIRDIELRGLKEGDIEYVKEIYSFFKFIAEKIRSGEYEKGLTEMKKNKNS